MMRIVRPLIWLCLFLPILALTACGQQGSPSPDTPSGDTPPVDSASVAAPSVDPQSRADSLSHRDQEPRKDILRTGVNLYSQKNEELIIRDFFQDRRDGFFLDVGCAWPRRNNTTYYLDFHLGWSGIGVDALSMYGEKWARERPDTKFVSYAISDSSGETVTFYQAKWPGNSSLNKDQALKHRTEEEVTPIEVETITLTDLLDANGVEKIDHLTLDIEGAEPGALAGFDIERFQPELVCIEAHGGEWRGAHEAGFLKYFGDHGYELIEEYLPYDTVNWYFRRIR